MVAKKIPLDTGRKLNVHKRFRRLAGRSIYVLCPGECDRPKLNAENVTVDLYPMA